VALTCKSAHSARYATAKSVNRRISSDLNASTMRSLGTPASSKLLRDSVLRPVTLNPKLGVNNVDVNQAPMIAANSIPADEHQQVMAVLAIEDGLELSVTVGIRNSGIFLEDRLNQQVVGLRGVHCLIVSDCGSNTIKRIRWLSASNLPIGSSKTLI
jgi:hypothetical protein